MDKMLNWDKDLISMIAEDNRVVPSIIEDIFSRLEEILSRQEDGKSNEVLKEVLPVNVDGLEFNVDVFYQLKKDGLYHVLQVIASPH